MQNSVFNNANNKIYLNQFLCKFWFFSSSTILKNYFSARWQLELSCMEFSMDNYHYLVPQRKCNYTKCSRTLPKKQIIVLSEKCILLPFWELIRTKTIQNYKHPTWSLEMMLTVRHQIIPSMNLSPEYLIIKMWPIFLNIL